MRVVAVHESGYVQVFGRRDDETIHALRRPASEKRQGTKSRREVVRRRCRRRAVPPARRLWGFGSEAGLPAICVGHPAPTGVQLKRSGTNVAKWGFHVLSHQGFQQLSRPAAAHSTTSA
jgi:hypothetical protein